jgi:rhodanese-related sulfurtransferase
VIGDEQTGAAAVIDPQRDVDQYIAFAAEHALQIKHVFLTHFHADFVAGHLELRERDQKYIAGSMSIPLNHLAENLEKIPRDRPQLIYCAGGYRSSIAASLLQRNGFDSVGEIAGGIAGWEAAQLPVQTG